MRKILIDVELNYAIMEKQAYALVKSLKHFRTYIEYSKVIAFVHRPTIKDILSHGIVWEKGASGWPRFKSMT
jgi:hypothetical protein